MIKSNLRTIIISFLLIVLFLPIPRKYLFDIKFTTSDGVEMTILCELVYRTNILDSKYRIQRFDRIISTGINDTFSESFKQEYSKIFENKEYILYELNNIKRYSIFGKIKSIKFKDIIFKDKSKDIIT